ncbi:MAG: noncanonical pyrimidine nucleotidase, YjjG family [Acidimicrobiia bacterium]|nr:noncanonical pyrimidine nucleotidase, YjjG family [Acidimicrobiia bacterium]
MRYDTLLFDLDHTLLDSFASEQAAFRAAMDVVGVDDPHKYFTGYEEINHELWAAVERGEMHVDDVKVTRFERFVEHFGFEGDPVEMAEAFVHGLGSNGELFPGVLDVLDALRNRATMVLVTNGVSQVQRMRVDRLRLEHYFPTIAISGELDFAKPDPRIYEWVDSQLGGMDKDAALMVGDSTSSDMQGGANFDIATAWYNPFHKPRPESPPITHEFHAFDELLGIVGID